MTPDTEIQKASKVIAEAVDDDTKSFSCSSQNDAESKVRNSRKHLQKIVAIYITMVVVSTLTIFFLEHASLVSAVRTALVAAVGKTVAASWVSSFFS